VIATGYSGNLEFMNEQNSVLLDYVESPIRAEDQYCDYTGDMAWAYPDDEDLARQIRWVYEARAGEVVVRQVARASADLARFDRRAVAARLVERLHAIRR
jgi:hypothetical protein